MKADLSKTKIGFLITFILSIAFVVTVYRDIALSPNEQLLTVYNDGLSNYFTFLYHIKHDTSFLSFNGMNYPYGEHIPFVDCQPVFSNTLKWISNNIVDISTWSIGILNTFLFLSIVLSSVFLYLILINYKVDFLFASLASIGISLLSSQTLLWEHGHFGLSYTWFFPAGWYFVIRYIQTDKKLLWSAIISINIIFLFYIHNYLGFILLLFTLLFHFIQLVVYSKTEAKKLKNYICIFIQVFIPLLLVYFISFGLDTHTGRIDMPFITEYRVTWQMIFLPVFSFLKPIYELVFNFSFDPELKWIRVGNYIGLVSNLALLFSIGYLVYWLIKKKFEKIKKTFPVELNMFFLAAVLILFYAMLFPMQTLYAWVFECIPKMKQFAAIGRFAWVFYYVCSVYSIYFLWNILKHKIIGKTLLLFLCILTIAEGWSNHYHLFEITGSTANLFQYPDRNFQIDEIKQSIKFEKYQAVLPLPFLRQYNTPGSFFGSDKSDLLSMQISYSTGLPLISAYLSRPSISEGRNITELFSPSYYFKEVKNDFLNKKPVIVVFSKEDLKICESVILKKSEIILNHPNFILAELSYDSLFSTGETKQIFAQYENIKSSLIKNLQSDFFLSDTTHPIIYESFDLLKSPRIFKGTGAYYGEKVKEKVIFQSKTGKLIPEVEYSLSFWYYCNLYDQSFVSICINEIDASGKLINSIVLDPMNPFINDNSWYFNDYHFKIKNKANHIRIVSKGKPCYDKFFYMDELLIRPVNTDVYKAIDESTTGIKILFKNNEYIRDNN